MILCEPANVLQRPKIDDSYRSCKTYTIPCTCHGFLDAKKDQCELSLVHVKYTLIQKQTRHAGTWLRKRGLAAALSCETSFERWNVFDEAN